LSRVRITGGSWRSRLVEVGDQPGLRPTPDRVRETLFNWLGQDLSGMHCLDLFAGSGVLGFEAASRGAASVVLVERNPRVASILRRNADLFGAEQRLVVTRADALEFAALTASRGQRFDLVFLDPPYRQDWLARLWPLLPALTATGGWLYVEAESAVTAPDPWQMVRQGRTGQVHYHLLQNREASEQQ
jgi:16S rRNA (guanine966-N2)-methyltransferase